METKYFFIGGKKITIKKIGRADLKKVKEFQNFACSLVEEEVKITRNEKVTLKEEKEFLKKTLGSTKAKKEIYIFAECDGKIVGVTSIDLGRERKNHIGGLGITIRDGYRGMGLGKYLMYEVIRLAQKELKPKPRSIQLEVYANNKPAIGLYKKMGFKPVAKLPKQFQWKGKLIDEIIMIKYL